MDGGGRSIEPSPRRARGLGRVTQPKQTRRGSLTDEHGLYLRVSARGAKSWIQRLNIQGLRTDNAIGHYPAMSLAEARVAAFERWNRPGRRQSALGPPQSRVRADVRGRGGGRDGHSRADLAQSEVRATVAREPSGLRISDHWGTASVRDHAGCRHSCSFANSASIRSNMSSCSLERPDSFRSASGSALCFCSAIWYFEQASSLFTRR